MARNIQRMTNNNERHGRINQLQQLYRKELYLKNIHNILNNGINALIFWLKLASEHPKLMRVGKIHF